MVKRERGFTLIELIVVMAIILILAGMITGAAQKAKERAMVAKARAMISALETSLGMFQADVGIYPATGSIANVYTGLTNTSGLTTAQAGNWAGPYMNFQQNEVDGSNNILDPWNKAYHYTSPGATAHNFGSYIDLWSEGPNKTDNSGAGDDISNWRR